MLNYAGCSLISSSMAMFRQHSLVTVHVRQHLDNVGCQQGNHREGGYRQGCVDSYIGIGCMDISDIIPKYRQNLQGSILAHRQKSNIVIALVPRDRSFPAFHRKFYVFLTFGSFFPMTSECLLFFFAIGTMSPPTD